MPELTEEQAKLAGALQGAYELGVVRGAAGLEAFELGASALYADADAKLAALGYEFPPLADVFGDQPE